MGQVVDIPPYPSPPRFFSSSPLWRRSPLRFALITERLKQDQKKKQTKAFYDWATAGIPVNIRFTKKETQKKIRFSASQTFISK